MKNLINKYIEQTFPLKCKGRNVKRKEVLEKPVEIEVKIYKSPVRNSICSEVKCHYISGSNGDKCSASINKSSCPYSFEIPHAIDNLFGQDIN